MLFGIEPVDPLTLVLAAGGLTMIAVAASAIPAACAAGVNPMKVLREEGAFSASINRRCGVLKSPGTGRMTRPALNN